MWKPLIVIIVLSSLALACNLPVAVSPDDVPTPTPIVYVTVLVATPTPESIPENGSPEPTLAATITVTPTPTATAIITATPTLTTTATITPTATPKGPTPTPTLLPMGQPLGFAEPAWELLEWHEDEGTGEWVGSIRINVIGGVSPYRAQLEDQEIVSGTVMPARWRLCKLMPATVRVWSADGQTASTGIWIGELGCEP